MTTLNYWFTGTEGIAMSNRNTVASAHDRIDVIEPRVTKLETTVHLQFKEVFARVKRLEAILIATAGTTIAMLLAVLSKMS